MKRDYRTEIESLIGICKEAACAGAATGETGRRTLPEISRDFVRDLSPQDFLKWVEADKEYSFFYYDVQQDGFCAKPAEVAAMILERIILDHLESN